MLNKVPEVTLYFWVIKVLCTTVGETAADFLNENLGLGLTDTTFVMSAVLVVALVFQFRLRRYVPGVYWLAVVLISVVGTLITDNLTDNFGVSLVTTTIVFSVALAATFAAWYASERTLSIHTHLHHAARGVLLAGGPLHLRARHRGGRPDRRAARHRLLAVGADLRRDDRGRVRRARALRAERDPRVLDRLHPDPAARRVDRRLPLPADAPTAGSASARR